MRPPASLPSTLVALGEAFARQAHIAPDDFWDYVYRKRPPPPEVRAAIVEGLFPAVSPGDFLLTARPHGATLATTVSSATVEASASFKKGFGQVSPDVRHHAFVAKLIERHETVTEAAHTLTKLARKKGYPSVTRQALQSYYAATERDRRGIPRWIAELIRDTYQVPESAWARVIG